jgi:outer membrane receptor protein involved in Fe transport
MSSLALAGAAFAQAATAPQADQNQLEEVVVTATRQADTVNRVPLAVTAQTQRSLDQQGIRTVRDLTNIVPSLQTTQSLASGASQFSIRGIGFLGNNPAGAAPVGFYLDDTPLQKRNVGGGVATSNGTPLPPIFDLDRVEVLRGPQGTLFGGGSEGGTIRYIQPAPSLTRYSEYARAQYSTPSKGDDSYEVGVAAGGPIIQDKLGFRASVFTRKTGGFIDRIDPLSKREVLHNSGGEGRINSMRAALAWAPTENSRITFDYFSSVDKSKDIATSYTLDLPNAVSVPTLCFNTNNTPNALSGFDANGLGLNTAARVGSVASIPANPAAAFKTYPYPVARGDAACAQARANNDVTYTLPGFTYGPYNLDKYDSISTYTSPSKTNLQIASLSAEYNFEHMTVKSITSYIDDQTKTVTDQRTPQGGLRSNSIYIDPVLGRQVLANGPAFHPALGAEAWGVSGYFVSNNRRYGITQEIRFSSAGGEAERLSWVGGVYYSNIRGKAAYDNFQPNDFFSCALWGLCTDGTLARTGVRNIESAPGLLNNYDQKRQQLKDVEIAGFAEANYWIVPEKLKATAGIRVSRVSFSYNQTFLGPVTSVGIENGATRTVGSNVIQFRTPTDQNGGTNSGSTSESPVTPKFGLQYQISDNDMVYVTAAKGFRAGGVNSQVSYGICQVGLDTYGFLPADLPQEYKSDSVWSYELGAKLRLFNGRAQVNGSVYQIDWNDPQYTTPPPQCGLVTTFNAPKARVRGAELELTARLFRGFTANGSFGYTDGKYTAPLVFEGRAAPQNNFVKRDLVLVTDGQAFSQPKYTYNIGARYEFNVTDDAQVYIRGDWRHSSSFAVAPFPSSNYTPDSFNQAYGLAYFRAGVNYKDFDINVFVNNAFNRDEGSLGGGRSSCLTLECTTQPNGSPAYQGYNPLRTINTGYPREIGLQIAFRH